MRDASRARPQRPLEGPFWVAVLVGLSLALLCGASLMALLTQQSWPNEPRRRSFAVLWPTVTEGLTLPEVVARLGPADETEPAFERVPAGSDPCTAGAASVFHTCVQTHRWYSSVVAEQADVYSVCTDTAGIVRRANQGTAFQLRYLSGGGDLERFVAGQALLILLGVPVAVALRLWHRWKPMTDGGLPDRDPS